MSRVTKIAIFAAIGALAGFLLGEVSAGTAMALPVVSSSAAVADTSLGAAGPRYLKHSLPGVLNPLPHYAV